MEQDKFYELEYQAAQQRLLQSGQLLHQIETIVPLALAAYYAWVWSQHLSDGLMYRVALLIPVCLVAMAFIRHAAELRFIARNAAYVHAVEEHLIEEPRPAKKDGPRGFEGFYRNGKAADKLPHSGKNRDPFLFFRIAYWLPMFLATIALFLCAPALWPPTAPPDPVKVQIVTPEARPVH